MILLFVVEFKVSNSLLSRVRYRKDALFEMLARRVESNPSIHLHSMTIVVCRILNTLLTFSIIIYSSDINMPPEPPWVLLQSQVFLIPYHFLSRTMNLKL